MADTGGKTILVKKADGTMVRMSLDEIRQKKAGASTPPAPVQVAPTQATPAPKKPPAVVPDNLPVEPVVEQKIAPTPAPVAPPRPAKPALPKADMSSLLEEPAPKTSSGAPLISLPRDAQADEIIGKLSFTVSKTNLNRLRTLIQLRLKDIRSVNQVEEALSRSEQDGGVGLTREQAHEVLKHLPGFEELIPYKKELPATTTPFNAFKHSQGATSSPKPVAPAPLPPVKPVVQPAPPKPAFQPPPKPMVASSVATPVAPRSQPAMPPRPAPAPVAPITKEKVIETFAKTTAAEDPFMKLAADSRAKSSMKDIIAKPAPVGPTDEIRSFGLTDFRRLSSKPEEAALRLKQKFINLQGESILLYLEALDAWKASPLYGEYVTVAIRALAGKQALSSLSDTKTITFPEMQAIITMERQLDYL
jgi:hypothetical protein